MTRTAGAMMGGALWEGVGDDDELENKSLGVYARV
jgi:hypothetical protein